MINLIFEMCKKGRRGKSEFRLDRKSLHCNFKKGGSSTTVQSYQPTPEERRLMNQAAKYSEAVAPNALRLNTTARDLLWDSLGSNQVDFNRLNNNAQSQISKATSGLNSMIGANTNATNATNRTLGTYTPQFQTAANTANSTLGGISNQYTTAGNTANSTLGGISNQYTTAGNTANNALGGISNQYTTAGNAVNSALANISPQYQTVANATNRQLAGLANGVIPSQYQTNMENSIRSALQNTMGNTVNSLGQRGVLNSSVTNSAMNDISRNAADTVAQQYQNNINMIGNLNQQQLGNTNTALGAQSELAQQQFGNTNAVLGARGELAQQQFGNTNAVLGARGELAQQQFGNTNAVLGARGELAQQRLSNTNNSLESQLGVAQNQLGNTMNTNQFNAGLYGNLIDSAASPIATAASAQEAAQQPALNLWNASVGLNQGGTGTALAGVSGKGTTTATQSMSGGGGLLGNTLGGLFGGIASGWASAWCFAEDTLIKMADGTAKYIQDIVKGDKVACPHADGTESVEEVTDVMEPHHADTYALTAKDKDNNYHVVLTTSTQPLLCADGTFATVGNMKIGKTLHGGLVVQSIEYDEFCKVYDLKVSGENNYYADGFAAKGGTVEW